MTERGQAEDGRDEMPEPIIGTVLAKAIGTTADSEAQKTATGLFMRVFGPSADEIGEALRRYTAYKLRNVGRIVENADAKSNTNPIGGMVNTRLAYVLLEEGSLCDDELMANYLGGILAGSRSPDGRDDRAIAWSGVITSLSSLQVRAHYLLYREWADRLHGVARKYMMQVHRKKIGMDFDLDEFVDVLVSDTDVGRVSAMTHSIYGLVRAGLLSDRYWWDDRRKTDFLTRRRPFESTLHVEPSSVGMELYEWAQGLSGATPFDFPSKALVFDAEPAIPRLSRVRLRRHQLRRR